MKRKVEVRTFVEIEIPDNELQERLKDYKKIIDENGTENDIFEHIAYNVVINGTQDFVEGIGEISLNQHNKYDADGSEVTVKVDYDYDHAVTDIL